VREYTERFYLPASRRSKALIAEGGRRARELAAWKARVAAAWDGVRVDSVEGGAKDGIQVGEAFEVRARVGLNGLEPQDVAVELYLGEVDPEGDLVGRDLVEMRAVESDGGIHTFAATGAYGRSGRQGFTVRVLPSHPDLTTSFLPGLVRWA
jgi:starch phosphorylase